LRDYVVSKYFVITARGYRPGEVKKFGIFYRIEDLLLYEFEEQPAKRWCASQA
jgi:hypothetical protein